MRFLLATTALVLSAATALAIDPVGSYQVEGTNPRGGARHRQRARGSVSDRSA